MAIMAAIERGEGSPDAVVRGWLARALTASRGPQWVCDSCNTVHGTWAAVCDQCGSFDSLTWREPPAPATPPGSEMLPLIVGDPAPGGTPRRKVQIRATHPQRMMLSAPPPEPV